MSRIVKILVCVMLLNSIFVGCACACTIDKEQNKYNNADEKTFNAMEQSFKSQYKHYAGTKNVIVISSSANFECCNSVRHFQVLSNGKIKLTDYNGKSAEVVTVKHLQSNYSCYIMAKAPCTFDTSGKLSSNFKALKV